MAWRIELTETAERDLAALDKQVQLRITKFLRERVAPSDDPHVLAKPMSGKYAGLWRFRVGDYRLICNIRTEALVVLVVVIGHRSGVYR